MLIYLILAVTLLLAFAGIRKTFTRIEKAICIVVLELRRSSGSHKVRQTGSISALNIGHETTTSGPVALQRPVGSAAVDDDLDDFSESLISTLISTPRTTSIPAADLLTPRLFSHRPWWDVRQTPASKTDLLKTLATPTGIVVEHTIGILRRSNSHYKRKRSFDLFPYKERPWLDGIKEVEEQIFDDEDAYWAAIDVTERFLAPISWSQPEQAKLTVGDGEITFYEVAKEEGLVDDLGFLHLRPLPVNPSIAPEIVFGLASDDYSTLGASPRFTSGPLVQEPASFLPGRQAATSDQHKRYPWRDARRFPFLPLDPALLCPSPAISKPNTKGRSKLWTLFRGPKHDTSLADRPLRQASMMVWEQIKRRVSGTQVIKGRRKPYIWGSALAERIREDYDLPPCPEFPWDMCPQPKSRQSLSESREHEVCAPERGVETLEVLMRREKAERMEWQAESARLRVQEKQEVYNYRHYKFNTCQGGCDLGDEGREDNQAKERMENGG